MAIRTFIKGLAISFSRKQKINAKNLTEAELIRVMMHFFRCYRPVTSLKHKGKKCREMN